MEQRLRLVQGSTRYEKRMEDRHPIQVPGEILWKDAKGNARVTPVVTEDVSGHGVRVRSLGGAPIPMYRLVYFQVERSSRSRADLPAPLRRTSVLSAIFRVGPVSDATGAPNGYALRLMVEPERKTAAAPVTWAAAAPEHRTA